MKAKTISKRKLKAINKEIFDHVVSAIVFTIMFISMAIIVTNKYIKSNLQKVYNENGFAIQINPKINKTLDILSDLDGLDTTSNNVNITNNNSEKRKYQLILTPINGEEEDIRVLLDNSLLRSLSKFDKIENAYIIAEVEIYPGLTNSHSVRMWQDIQSQNKKINVDFKLEVKTNI